MAARKKRVLHDDQTRLKIRTSQLVNRLQNNALGTLDKPLEQGQIKCIEILLRKSLPDLTSVELTGKDGGPIETREMSDIEIARRMAFFLTKAQNGAPSG